ncbi:MAG TPA: hypothetical protein VGI21_08730 [Streptosporangiaceae bacterium]|jgi:hypothetical protein
MEPSAADHERAIRAGRNLMANLAAEDAKTAGRDGGKATKLPGLGVRVRGGQVYRNEMGGRLLGSLAGAHAELTDGTRPHRVGAALVAAPLSLGAGLLLGLTRKSKASAFVVFADGTVHEHKLSGKTAIGQAQGDAVKLNALAAAARGALRYGGGRAGG